MNNNLNIYLANLAVANVKLHNLHWNVKGITFKQVHEYLEELYDDFFVKFDEVAEAQKMRGSFPLASLKSYLEVTTIKELESKPVDAVEALKIAVNDIELMKDLATTIRNQADEEGDFGIVAIMEEHAASYDKVIWFVDSMI